jgi:hypothetical protein
MNYCPSILFMAYTYERYFQLRQPVLLTFVTVTPLPPHSQQWTSKPIAHCTVSVCISLHCWKTGEFLYQSEESQMNRGTSVIYFSNNLKEQCANISYIDSLANFIILVFFFSPECTTLAPDSCFMAVFNI